MYIGYFQPTATGYRCELDLEARLIIARLSGEIMTLLDAPADENAVLRALVVDETREPPEDPALLSLLPPMSEDPDEAQALRTLTEDTLRLTKSERLLEIITALENLTSQDEDALEVPKETAWEWLSALNDVRLVLAQRLEVQSPQSAQAALHKGAEFFAGEEDGDEEEIIAALYYLITWWQDSLLQAVRFSDLDQ
ncbi:MAG: DUF2017 family protein [Actinomycetaceae bacterium]|nr:DUF2017 family protein [Actinomycetaceae bacterium]